MYVRTHVNNVDGLEEVKLDIKDSVEALPQIPMEAATGYAMPNRVEYRNLPPSVILVDSNIPESPRAATNKHANIGGGSFTGPIGANTLDQHVPR